MSQYLNIRWLSTLRWRLRLFACLSFATAVILPKNATAQALERSGGAIARVAGEAIYQDDLPALAIGQVREARQHEYDLTMTALQEVVRQKVLAAEAKRRGLTSEKLLQQEVDSKVTEPTAGEVQAFYLGHKDHERLSFDEVKAAFQQELRQAKIQTAREAFLRALQQQAEVQVLLQRPKVSVKFDSGRLKGSPTAKVVIVEFSDFSCPFCRQVESTLGALLAKYPGEVSLAYRDFPVRQIHPQAELAAEASRCAEEEGKYWEYHDLLFGSPDKLRRDDLLRYAHDMSLDDRRFASCLESGLYKTQVEQDVQDGLRAGVSATPAFFINGVFLKGAQSPTSFEEIIDQELGERAKTDVNAKR